MREKSTNKPNGKNLEAVNAEVAESREEIAALAAGLNELTKRRLEDHAVDRLSWLDSRENGGTPHRGWKGFRRRLGDVSTRGGEVAKGIAHEIERHPLIGGLAAFGLGFGIAMLLFKRSKRVFEQ
ncbi:MAG: hypothetical protein A2289_14335 [Deltaproteobacteria bacterium RIFOXYA12_FULL_58_15]|nr:MAG: hypothetical protein A2289_14335 [Deltaproteobacteria bacterium RIFOXYA12_FULL_58_15]OGR13997.1 MAG: hypothetical protein A2341_24765 [Deltaproteobacteria bacterium RIFOXYB12_FULL_58_9]